MSAAEDRVLIFAPTGRDGFLLEESLRSAGLNGKNCRDPQTFVAELALPNGAIVLTEEALSIEMLAVLVETADRQPPWSDLPILLMTFSSRSRAGRSAHLGEIAGKRGNVTLVERPTRMDTLISVVNSALRSRRHQYEIRDHLKERERNEEKYREAAKLESVGVLAGGIAHDFNNLLTGIIGNASLGLEMIGDREDLRERFSEVVQAGERAAELTTQLLAYAGKGRFVIKPLDLSELTSQIAPLVKRFVPSYATLQLELQDQLPLVEGDSGQLQQVVMNLIINAGEAIQDGAAGTVAVSTGVRYLTPEDCDWAFVASTPEPGEYVYLNVEDSGAGMTDEVKSRIFDPFFTTKFLGRGLGLAAVMGIVRGHKGALRVVSEVGKGTMFTVYLPVLDHAAPKPSHSKSEPAASVRATILFVDDEPTIRSLASRSLPAHGISVHLAENGPAALKIFTEQRSRISLVVLDMTMPGMGFKECYEELRAISPDVPVILSSGFPEDMLHDRFAGSGIAGFLQKPYAAKQLVEKIRSLLVR